MEWRIWPLSRVEGRRSRLQVEVSQASRDERAIVGVRGVVDVTARRDLRPASWGRYGRTASSSWSTIQPTVQALVYESMIKPHHPASVARTLSQWAALALWGQMSGVRVMLAQPICVEGDRSLQLYHVAENGMPKVCRGMRKRSETPNNPDGRGQAPQRWLARGGGALRVGLGHLHFVIASLPPKIIGSLFPFSRHQLHRSATGREH